MMSALFSAIEKWYLRNRPTLDLEFSVALTTPISDQKWLDSLLIVSLISEIEFHTQKVIRDELIYSMRDLTLEAFLEKIATEL
jgi:hypothetical protein